jgi:GTPase SAR1 family protein
LYSITQRSSFDEVEGFRRQIFQVKDVDASEAPPIGNCPRVSASRPPPADARPRVVRTVLVGNKSDLAKDREVSTQEGQHLAQQWGCAFFEASAKTRTNVDEVLLM